MNRDDHLARPKFFPGQLLTDKDLSALQDYLREKVRRHNRYLHGWGVVNGLSVSIVNGQVLVEPGIAIDCAGNEVWLTERATFELPLDMSRFYVVVEYFESEAEAVPECGTPDYADSGNLEHTRIVERCRVYTVEEDPATGHDHIGPGTCGCGRGHPLPIAVVTIESKESTVVPCGRT